MTWLGQPIAAFVLSTELEICKQPDGSLWQLGAGGFGRVYKALRFGCTPVAVVSILLGWRWCMWEVFACRVPMPPSLHLLLSTSSYRCPEHPCRKSWRCARGGGRGGAGVQGIHHAGLLGCSLRAAWFVYKLPDTCT